MRVIGYVFDQPNGCYQYKYYFEGSLQKISTFILQNRMKCKKITITDIADCLICTYDDGIFYFGVNTEVAEAIVQMVNEAIYLKPIQFKFNSDYDMEEIE